jgi:hypothetical protein
MPFSFLLLWGDRANWMIEGQGDGGWVLHGWDGDGAGDW